MIDRLVKRHLVSIAGMAMLISFVRKSSLMLLAILSPMLAYSEALPPVIDLNSEVKALQIDTSDANNSEAEPQESSSPANNFDYRVELLVFAYRNTGDLNSELWRNPERPNTDTFLFNANSFVRPSPYRFLNIQQKGVSELTGIKRKMKVNGRYRILQHQIWDQSVVEQEKQDRFYVAGGKSLQDDGLRNSDRSTTQGDSSTSKGMSLNQYKQKELEGTIHIYHSRFLHIKTDLWLSDYAVNNIENDAGLSLANDSPSLQAARLQTTTNEKIKALDSTILNENLGSKEPSTYSTLTNFHLNEHRRIRSGELHYLDHPRFGLLIKFTRLSDL